MYQTATAPNTGVAVYMNPMRGRPAYCGTGPWTDYFINVVVNTGTAGEGVGAACPAMADSKRNLTSISDGTSNTVFVGDGQLATGDYSASTALADFSSPIWTGGTYGTCRGGPFATLTTNANGTSNATAVLAKDPNAASLGAAPNAWGGPFSEGALMGMGDGTVRLFPYSMQATAFGAFLTPQGGESVQAPDA